MTPAYPTTAAGKRMLENWWERRTHPPTAARQQAYCDFILAIEAEARADLLADLTRQIEGLPDVTCHRWHEHTDKAQSNIGISRAAVLKVLVDGLRESGDSEGRDAEGERRG